MIASVVIPTFNRGPLLAETVEHVLRCRVPGKDEVEVIVVDDGSRVPAEATLGVLPSKQTSFRVLRQENAGPGAARNAGFRVARGDVVLFVDDDILVPPDLVNRHCDVHARFPGSVVFGHTYFNAVETPLLRYMNALAKPVTDEGLVPVQMVASGQLSVERRQFASRGGLYREDLRTPAAEEYELSYRLRSEGIPILFAPGIVGSHRQPVELSSMCAQQYKYGVGLAEAAAKCGNLDGMDELQAILRANKPLQQGDSFRESARNLVKIVLGAPELRPWTRRAVFLLEKVIQRGPILDLTYRAMLGASFYVGLQNGRRLYS
jgi:hypothetical protein